MSDGETNTSETPLVGSTPDDSVVSKTPGTLAPSVDGCSTTSTGQDKKDEYSAFCGWRCFRPRCLQKLNRPICLLACLCLFSMTQGMLINAFVPSSSSSLEKKFHFNYIQLGAFMACYDIAVLVVQLPVCYFGEKGHKGRWLASGMLLLAIGAVMCTIPHFASDIYHYNVNETDMAACAPGEPRESPPVVERHAIVYLVVLCFGQLLHGAGSSPIFTLGITYLDENTDPAVSPIYLGTYLGFSALGPAIGYLAGSFLLRVYGDVGKVNLKTITITYNDMRWYGAWWFGFLVTSGFAVIGAILMSCFPRRIKRVNATKDKAKTESDTPGTDATKVTTVSLGGKSGLGVKASFKLLWRCRAWRFMALVDLIEAIAGACLIAFFPKIMENFFAVSSSTASLLTGAAIVPSAFLGSVTAGYVMKRFHLTVSGMLMFCLCASSAAALLSGAFLANCPKPLLAGVTVPYGHKKSMDLPDSFKDEADLIHWCNADCYCSRDIFQPVCDVNHSIVYYSPCFAGCKSKVDNVFVGCSCIADLYNISEFEPVVSAGLCPNECVMLSVFLVLAALLVFSTILCIVTIQEAELRVVPHHLRTFAFGIRWVLVRLGTIPSPVVLGVLVDKSCILLHGRKCLIYNNQRMAWFLMIGALSMKLLVMLCVYLARRFYLDSIYRPTTAATKVQNETERAGSADSSHQSGDK